MATQTQILKVFLRLSGFNEGEILGVNYKSLTFVSTSGGKYQMSRDGKRVRKLSGPDYPNLHPTEV